MQLQGMERLGIYVRLMTKLACRGYEKSAKAACQEVFAFWKLPAYLFHSWCNELEAELFEGCRNLWVHGEDGLDVAHR